MTEHIENPENPSKTSAANPPGRGPGKETVILATLGLVVSVFSLVPSLFGELPALLTAVGRFHPMAVHIPIGFVVLAAFMAFMEVTGKSSSFESAIKFALFYGGIAVWVAALVGALHASSGEFDEDLLEKHRILACITGWMVFLVWRCYSIEKLRRWIPYLFAALVGVLVATGHLGGSITHGEGFLSSAFVDAWEGNPSLAQADVLHPDSLDYVYEDLVEPLLVRRCVNCHGPRKQKGKLRLDTYPALLRGGEGGSVITGSSPEESPIFLRVTLPRSHEDHMPPKGKTSLDDAQIRLLRWWIENGAQHDLAWNGETEPDEIKAYAAARMIPETESGDRENRVYQDPLSPAEKKRWDILGIVYVPVSRYSQDITANLAYVKPDSLQNALAQVSRHSDRVIALDLSAQRLAKTDTERIAGMKRLKTLHLQQSNIADDNLAILKSLPDLQYLNLYGTSVSDAGMAVIKQMVSLERVYLWQTNVSPTGITTLKTARPDLQIVYQTNLGPKPDSTRATDQVTS